MRRNFGLFQHDLTGTGRSMLTKLAQKISTFFTASSLGLVLMVSVPAVTLSGCGMFSGGEGNYPPSKAERRRSGGTVFGGDDDDDGGLVIFGDGGIFGGGSGRTEEAEAPTAQAPGAEEDRGFLGGVLGGGSSKSSTPKLGVNSYLWRASLDTISFMPLKSADPFGGVIITDWYADPKTPGERFKLTVYILDTNLRADGVRVTAFRQTADGRGGWSDAAVNPRIAPSLENAILLRARELRIGTGG